MRVTTLGDEKGTEGERERAGNQHDGLVCRPSHVLCSIGKMAQHLGRLGCCHGEGEEPASATMVQAHFDDDGGARTLSVKSAKDSSILRVAEGALSLLNLAKSGPGISRKCLASAVGLGAPEVLEVTQHGMACNALQVAMQGCASGVQEGVGGLGHGERVLRGHGLR